MGEPGVTGLALRIERGRAGAEELAALAVVLCSLLAGRRAADAADTGREPPPGVPSWRRPEHSGAAYRSPYCWR
ncbi:acyl-CoA carboxylase epsilon subunit [Streptomyces spiralis]|uniref:acyl-CoA carboxylase epsilon subunit n=1 Tax=Streptomyces spiralis TaxID=66376 RepID=UPI0036C230DC